MQRLSRHHPSQHRLPGPSSSIPSSQPSTASRLPITSRSISSTLGQSIAVQSLSSRPISGTNPSYRSSISPATRPMSSTADNSATQQSVADKQPLSSPKDVHSMSLSGFSGDDATRLYNAVRPTYPPRIIEALITPIVQAYYNDPSAHGRPLRILDLGAGTGLLTRGIAEYLYDHVSESAEYEIYSLDPSQSMCTEFTNSTTIDSYLASKQPDASGAQQPMSRATAKAILDPIQPIKLGSISEHSFQRGFFDGVVAAQAFHWFTDVPSVRKIHQLLTPTGFYGFVWNYWPMAQSTTTTTAGTAAAAVTAPEASAWLYKLGEIQLDYFTKSSTPHWLTNGWREVIHQSGCFDHVTDHILQGEHRLMTRQDIYNRFDTVSVIRALSPEDKTEFVSKLDAILDSPEAQQDITQREVVDPTTGKVGVEAIWPMQYHTSVHFCQNINAKEM